MRALRGKTGELIVFNFEFLVINYHNTSSEKKKKNNNGLMKFYEIAWYDYSLHPLQITVFTVS